MNPQISYVYAKDLLTICTPFFSYSGIDNFAYSKLYKDDSRIVLNTNIDWHEYLYNTLDGSKTVNYNFLEKLINSKDCHKRFNQTSFLYEDIAPPNMVDSAKIFRIANWFYVLEKFEDYFEIFGFASQQHVNIANYYYNNLEIFKKFSIYFKEKSSEIITTHDDHRILPQRWDAAFQRWLYDKASNIHATHKRIQELEKTIQLNKFPINIMGEKKYISSRKLQCLQQLAQGKTVKEIAIDLGISNRTVEDHIVNLKYKLGVFSTTQLLTIFRKSALTDI